MKTSLSSFLSPRVLRWLAYGIGVLLLLAGIAWLAVPGVLKNTLEQQVLTQTGRKFSVGSTAFNPFTMTATVRNMVLYEPDKTTPAFSADEVVLNASLASLIHMAPVVKEFRLVHPQLHLVHSQVQGQDVSNFSDILEKFQAQPSSGTPVRFSVSNIQLQNGQIVLDDQTKDQHYKIDALNIGLPFISNFANAVDVFVEPSLSAKLNGSPLMLKARTKPFEGSHETTLAIDIDDLELAQFASFIPQTITQKLESAILSTRLDLHFADQKNIPEISLSGTASVRNLALADQHGRPLLKAAALNANIVSLNPVSGATRLQQLDIRQPQVWAGLDAKGNFNWQAPTASHTAQTAASSSSAGKTLDFTLAQLKIENGTLHWADAKFAQPEMALEITQLNLDVKQFSTAANAKPAEIKLTTGQADGEQLDFSGTLEPVNLALTGKLSLSRLNLANYQPYLNRQLSANLSGKLSVQSDITFKQNQLQLSALNADADDLLLQAKARESGSIALKTLSLKDGAVDTGQQHLQIDGIEFSGLHADLQRSAKGDLNLSHFLAAHTGDAGAAAQVNHGAHAQTWTANINHADLKDSAIGFADQSVTPAVAVHATGLNLHVDDISSKLDKPLKFTLQSGINKTGKIAVQGNAQLNAAHLKIDVRDFPVGVMQPYFTDFLNVTLSSGTASTQGQLDWKGGGLINYGGKLTLSNFKVQDKETGDDFLVWKTFDISGIQLALGGAQTNINLGKVALGDFYARAILSEQGKLNLHDILATKADGSTVSSADNTVQTAKPESAPAVASTAANLAANAAGATAAAATSAPVIVIGQIAVSNGTINYTDNFIKPHYSVRMTGMNGGVGKIASNVAQAADVNLNGKIDNDSPIAISGSLNPLFKPILLDIKTTANGIELPRLTTYSAKYAGYGIEKGKLSMDVHYRVENNQLTAQNSLMIDQLTFGEKVDSPSATKLPVQLVVALLKDSNGQINLDLPISGTITDPEFSLGGIIFKVFINLIGKVVTSPFSLLAHSMGGGEELAYVEFDSGSALLSDAGKQKLDTIAKALTNRPALKLDIIGRAVDSVDSAGLRALALKKQMRKFEGNSSDVASYAVLAPEHAKALEQVYSAGKFDKPRNVIGFAKSIPPADMEKLILANTAVSQDDLRNLANNRASAVRHYLEDVAHVNGERMFSIAPKLTADDLKDKASPSRVDFDLKM